MLIGFILVVVVAVGILLEYFIFRKENENGKKNKFWTSSVLLHFMVEIVIIFLGYFISMGITEWDDELKEKEKVVSMLAEACEFAQEQYDEHLPYFADYEAGELSIQQLEIYAALDLEYFDNVVSNDAVIKHLDTHTYGVFCKYLNYLEVIESQIDGVDYSNEELKYRTMYLRTAFFGRLIKVLDVCSIAVEEDLSPEEYAILMEILDEEKIQSYPIHKQASDYLIDREGIKED